MAGNKPDLITGFVQEAIASHNYFFYVISRNKTVITKLHLKYLIILAKAFYHLIYMDQ